MSWRLAKSLEKLLEQVNAAAPGRAKGWDGTIGDAAHAARESDHNPDAEGVVRALDITHDPTGGVDSERLADTLRLSHDPRIKYIISNRKIAAGYAVHGEAAWTWRPYAGENPHDHHCHISVVADDALADDVRPWPIDEDRPGLYRGVTATMFGGPSDAMSGAETAYGNLVAPGWWDRPGFALPARINDRPLPWIKATYNGKSVIGPLIDVGPWNTKDPYWISGTRPQAESGFDMTGRKTNLAGIDLTLAAANAIGLPGKGLVDWEFVKPMEKPPVTDPVTPSTDDLVKAIVAQLAAALGPIIANALKGIAPVLPPVVEPKPPPPVVVVPPVVVPPTPPPVLEKPGVGMGILGLLLSALLQWKGGIDVTEGGSWGQLLPIISAGVAGVGATGMFGGLGTALSALGPLLVKLLGGKPQ